MLTRSLPFVQSLDGRLTAFECGLFSWLEVHLPTAFEKNDHCQWDSWCHDSKWPGLQCRPQEELCEACSLHHFGYGHCQHQRQRGGVGLDDFGWLPNLKNVLEACSLAMRLVAWSLQLRILGGLKVCVGQSLQSSACIVRRCSKYLGLESGMKKPVGALRFRGSCYQLLVWENSMSTMSF